MAGVLEWTEAETGMKGVTKVITSVLNDLKLEQMVRELYGG